ncbi:MAG: DUF4105 domain-containing protein [Luteolibacter sp.]
MKRLRCISQFLLSAVIWLVLSGALLWAFGALWYDFQVEMLRHPLAWILLVGSLVALIVIRPIWHAKAGVAATIVLVGAWWFTLKPSNTRGWQPDVAQAAWAEVNGDVVTLHNVRNCDYRTETDYTTHWETRTLHLSQLTGIDIGIDYWGSPYMAHPMISFQFADALPVVMSIETRKEKGESYSAIGGLYRQYELIYLATDERDAFRVRTNYRKGEQIYLYHTSFTADQARARFQEYIDSMNAMKNRPRWYNAITTNCTTAIRSQHDASKRAPFDWRMLVNGFMDEMLYERGEFVADGLKFPDLKKRAMINDAAQAADQSADFSKLIREGRPGFGK